MKRICKRPVIIDKLKVCCEANNQEIINQLKTPKINDFYDLGKYRLIRIDAKDSKYQFVYAIVVNEAEKRYKFGTLQFGLYGMDKRRNTFPNGCLKIWFIVENRQLYTPDFLDRLIDVINTFESVLHNITHLDLCLDTPFDAGRAVNRFMRDKDTTTIINGKVCRDRKKRILGLKKILDISLDKDLNPSFYAPQTKALKHKAKGAILCCYDKYVEIQDSSNKDYILDYYNTPKKLYRTEIRLHNDQVQGYMTDKGITSVMDVFRKEVKEDLFFTYLNRIIRFRRDGAIIKWQEILGKK
jgi:hypothetical protein